MKIKILGAALSLGIALGAAWSSPASADTSLELLHGWNYGLNCGNDRTCEASAGRLAGVPPGPGAKQDFNGGTERTILTLKTFQPWKYGSVFIFYDITGPFTPPDDKVLPNEKGGFFGSISVNLSAKKIAEQIAGKKFEWGRLVDLSLHVEEEHVSKVGSISYMGAAFDFNIPHFDFVSMAAVARKDWTLAGVDLQLNGAWQMTIPLWKITDLVFSGFFAWGIFGQGKGTFTVGPDAKGQYAVIPTTGRPFFMTQPELLLDIGKLTTLVDRTFYAGIEYQLATNRYLVQGATEHVPQLMFKWAI